MDPQTLIIEAGVAIARYLWHKAHGESTSPDEAAIKAAGMKAAEMAARAAALEIERRAAAAGMQMASDLLAKAAAELLEALKVHGDIPRLDLPIEIVPADQPMPVEMVAPIDSDDVVTKPGV